MNFRKCWFCNKKFTEFEEQVPFLVGNAKYRMFLHNSCSDEMDRLTKEVEDAWNSI